MKTINRSTIKKVCAVVAILFLTCAISYAADPTKGDFKAWATGIITFFSQIKTFITIVATLVGMWFIYSAIQLFRKHHNQGAQSQGEHIKNGGGHLVLGVLLTCLAPGIQMFQSTISNDMGKSGSLQEFKINKNIFGIDPDADTK
ncbi:MULTISPECIES: hypothetical protein [Cysteiniphilum]|uniref:Uncharacterized protein n=1 Tax=Cysteiniphilum litorale TaxID=2056700 RepID=A0A8J3E9N9_9GAMM|nr:MULTISPECIES: hypothetical protein [Cysteiniphilum]GGG05127.1 hypothetical protein GCM10010995_23220 [Cysteiniphilum litorale]